MAAQAVVRDRDVTSVAVPGHLEETRVVIMDKRELCRQKRKSVEISTGFGCVGWLHIIPYTFGGMSFNFSPFSPLPS